MLHDLFPTRIYMNLVSNYEKIQEEFKAVADDMEWQNLWNTHLVSDNQFQDNLIKQYNLTTFEDELRTHVVSYVKEINSNLDSKRGTPLGEDPNVPYKITASWMTKYTKGHYAMCHEHGWSDIAGVYYHEVPEDSGGLFFEPPAPGLCDSLVYSKWGHRLTPKVSEGLMILFPGFLKHGIETNTTDLDRLSLSFNILFDRKDIYG